MAVYKVAGNYYSDELYHHGVKGMRHGVRRWQNPDGSYTNAGYAHYGIQKPGAQKMANQGNLTEYTDSGSGRGARVNTAVPVHNSGKADKSAYAAYKYGGAGGYKAYRDAKVTAEEAQNRLNANRDVLRADNAKRVQDNSLIQLQRRDRQFGPSQQYADQMSENTRINYVNNQRQLAEMGREARNAKDAYDTSSAPRRADDTRDWAGQRVSDVRRWGDQIGEDIRTAAGTVKNWADQAGRDIGKATEKAGGAVAGAAKDVGTWASGTVSAGRNFISGLFGKKTVSENPKPTAKSSVKTNPTSTTKPTIKRKNYTYGRSTR